MNFHPRQNGKLAAPSLSELHGIPVTWLGGLPIAVIDRARSADLMINLAVSRRGSGGPAPYITSANGQVLSLCASNSEVRALFTSADLIHADGTPMVFASRLGSAIPVPERVATTDLFHDVAQRAEKTDVPSTCSVPRRRGDRACGRDLSAQISAAADLPATAAATSLPREESDVVAEINAAQPDILWIGMGVPAEQNFCLRNRARLDRVGLIKTVRRAVRLRVRPESAVRRVDAIDRARMGIPHGSRAAPARLSLSHDESPCALFAADLARAAGPAEKSHDLPGSLRACCLAPRWR